jgi:hypothetical protein
MPALSVLSIDQVSLGKISRLLRSLRDSPDFIPNLQSLHMRLDTPDRPSSERGHAQSVDNAESDPEDLEPALDYDALADALFTRWGEPKFANARLTKFRLTWLDPTDFHQSLSKYITEENVGLRPDPDILERLSDLVDDGMQIYLGSEDMSWL